MPHEPTDKILCPLNLDPQSVEGRRYFIREWNKRHGGLQLVLTDGRKGMTVVEFPAMPIPDRGEREAFLADLVRSFEI